MSKPSAERMRYENIDGYIRPFELGDTETVLRIWLDGNLQAHRFIPAAYWKSNIGFMRSALSQAELFVCSVGGEIVAFVGLQGDYIAGIFVREDHRSEGIGHRLLAYLEQRHEQLRLSVYEKNARAVKFYSKEGFAIVEKRTDEPTGETEYVMTWCRSAITE